MLVKSVLDRVGALFGLALLMPLILIIAVLVRATSSGPALYWSSRVGRQNQPFMMPKFRTMNVGSPIVATHLLLNPKDWLTPLGLSCESPALMNFRNFGAFSKVI